MLSLSERVVLHAVRKLCHPPCPLQHPGVPCCLSVPLLPRAPHISLEDAVKGLREAKGPTAGSPFAMYLSKSNGGADVLGHWWRRYW